MTMIMKNKILALIMCCCCVMAVSAQEFEGRRIISAKLGYNIGGTMPLGLPASIRHLNSYKPQLAPAVGVDVLFPIDSWRGFLTGFRVERKAMNEDANVKNYYMEITQGGQTLAGVFTGDVTTRVSMWAFTLPVQAVWRVNRVNLRMGPYASLLFHKDFSGWAHGGHLRVDDPTGAKVELGEADDERGNYDFDEHMCNWQVGLTVGADWHLTKRFGLYADLNWGFSTLFYNDFHTIAQGLYPIFGQLGVSYRIK